MTNHNLNHRGRIIPLNPPDAPMEQKARELEGNRLPEEQSFSIDQTDIDTLATVDDTAIYESESSDESGDDFRDDYAEDLELVAEVYGDELPIEIEEELAILNDDAALFDQIYNDALPASLAQNSAKKHIRLDLLTELELRAEETSDPTIATEEGYAYVPPIDPPIVPGAPGTLDDFVIASGMGISALDEPYDESHHSDFTFRGDEMSARVREAIQADSSTTHYAHRIKIITRGNVVILRGLVDDLIDAENLVAVAMYVEGVDDVRDELMIRGM